MTRHRTSSSPFRSSREPNPDFVRAIENALSRAEASIPPITNDMLVTAGFNMLSRFLVDRADIAAAVQSNPFYPIAERTTENPTNRMTALSRLLSDIAPQLSAEDQSAAKRAARVLHHRLTPKD